MLVSVAVNMSLGVLHCRFKLRKCSFLQLSWHKRLMLQRVFISTLRESILFSSDNFELATALKVRNRE